LRLAQQLGDFAGGEPASFGCSIYLLFGIGTAAVAMHFVLAYLLFTRRRFRTIWRLAAVSCIGFPVGTVLGGVSLWALTRPGVERQFQ
jgi:Ni/Fe-hydrogenase subunit HybB-like protein